MLFQINQFIEGIQSDKVQVSMNHYEGALLTPVSHDLIKFDKCEEKSLSTRMWLSNANSMTELDSEPILNSNLQIDIQIG